MPVILATQEAEIRRITVQSQPRQIVWETPFRKNPSLTHTQTHTHTHTHTQGKAGGVAKGEGSEFKPQY
jgi:hypothetical protein